MEFNDDENPYGANATPLVTIKSPKYSKYDVSLAEDKVVALLELNAATSTAVREGLDLVVVLDVSGSIQGEKLASMKRAMHFVIMKLTPIDRLSIVAFSSSATRHCPLRCVTERARADLTEIVDRLVVRDGSNIQAGLDTALAIIDSRTTTSARTTSVYLVSGGQQDNLTEVRMLEPSKVPVYTFGFGKDADHHRLLADVASKSPGGTFSLVPAGKSVIGPFAQLLGGLLAVVAQDVRLTLTPMVDEPRDLDTMSVASGTDYTQTTDADTGVITIRFGTLFCGETRKVAVHLMLLETDDTAEYDAPLAMAQHSYTAQGEVHKGTPQDISILRTPSDPVAANRTAQEVLAKITARQQHAVAIISARKLADGKNMDGARRKLADAMSSLEIEELDQTLAGMLRVEIQQLLALMESQEMYEEKGRQYGLVSQLSHGRQRYAVKGDAYILRQPLIDWQELSNEEDLRRLFATPRPRTDGRLFATPRMDAYLKQAKQFEEDPTALLPSADDDLRDELAANPIPAFSAPIIFRLKAATLTPQEIEMLTTAPVTT